LMASAEELVDLPSFKLAFPADSDTASSNWVVGEKAVKSETSLSLTAGIRGPQEFGYVWHEAPLESDSFEAILTFAITSKESSADLPGEGLILAFAKEKVGKGDTFGFDSKLQGLAIVLDTKDNDNLHNSPSISAHLLKGKPFSHEDDGISEQLAGCIAGIRARSRVITLKIVYEASSKTLSVLVDLRGAGNFQKCLSVADVDVPQSKFVGIAAMSSGGDRHDIYGVQIFGTLDAALRAKEYLSNKAVKETVRTDSDQSSQEISLEQLSKIAHERLNKLLKSSENSVDVHELGQALDEIEGNLVLQMNTKFVPIVESLLSISDKQTKFSEQIATLRQQELPKFQATIQDINRKISDIPGMQSSNSKLIDQVLGKLEKSVDDMIRDHVRKLEFKIMAMGESSSNNFSFWVVVFMFQILFAIVVVMSFFNQRKELKLL